MRKMAAALALGLALTGCAGTAQQQESTRPTTSTSVAAPEVAMTAIELARHAGLKGAVDMGSSGSVGALTAAAYGHVTKEPVTDELSSFTCDYQIETYASKDAMLRMVDLAKQYGGTMVWGFTHGTYWSVIVQQGTYDEAVKIAKTL